MKKSIASLLVSALGLLLLVYSASRSIDFIQMTMPDDQRVLAWFGLAALDGGLVFWLLFFLSGAKGGWQRGIALLMVIVDFVGVVGMFTLDTLYRSAEAGMIAQLSNQEIRSAVLVLSGVIALNIGATVGVHLMDPENLKRMAAEEANDQIEAAALEQIKSSADSLAAELAPRLAADWSDATRRAILPGCQWSKGISSSPRSLPVMAASRSRCRWTLPARPRRSNLLGRGRGLAIIASRAIAGAGKPARTSAINGNRLENGDNRRR